MRLVRGLLVNLVLAGMLSLVCTPAAFAHGRGGGGIGGGGHGGRFGGGGYFDGFVGHGVGPHEGDQFATHHSHRVHYRYRRRYLYGGPYSYDYPYYGYYDQDGGDYSDATQASPSEPAAAEQTNIAVQQELTKLGVNLAKLFIAMHW